MSGEPERRPEFFQETPEYHGVVAADGRWRLAVSPNGTRYLLQELTAEGAFMVRRWRKELSKLLPDLPEGLAGSPVVATLPELPGEVDRPWADAMQAASDRVRGALVWSDRYGGVIAAAGDVRLVISPNGERYLLQEREDGRWRTVFRSAKASSIFDLVFSRLHAEHKAAAFCRVPALMTAVAKLPAVATAYRHHRRVERVAEALKGIGRG